MVTKDIFNILKKHFNDDIIELTETASSDSWITINHTNIKQICLFLRDEVGLEFDYFVMLTGMDYVDKLGVVYHLLSLKHNHRLVLKTHLNRDKPNTFSVERVWKTANWHEREAFDMFGIRFEQHPDLDRILCPDDWNGYPLRKDYIAPSEYNGIDATYNNPN